MFSTSASAEWECVETLVSFRKINLRMSLCLLGSCKCLPYVEGFGFKHKILSCDKENLCDSSKPRLPFHRTNYFILHLKRTSQNASTITSQPQTNFSSLLWQHRGFSALKGPLRTLSLSLFQTHSLKHTPSRILLPACTSVCKHIPLAADPRPSCYYGNQSPSP